MPGSVALRFFATYETKPWYFETAIYSFRIIFLILLFLQDHFVGQWKRLLSKL
jgi:hypothetical protein